MDLKAAIAGKDRQTILNNCEFGEDAAQKAYRSALEEDDLSANVRATIESQKQLLLEAHDRIKMMRDRATV